MFVLFPDHAQDYLTPELFALVAVRELCERHAIAELEPLILLETDGSVRMACVIPDAYPAYAAQNLADAREMHAEYMHRTLLREVNRRVRRSSRCGVCEVAKRQPTPGHSHVEQIASRA